MFIIKNQYLCNMKKVIDAHTTLFLENIPAFHPVSGKKMDTEDVIAYISDLLAKHDIYVTANEDETFISEIRETAEENKKSEKTLPSGFVDNVYLSNIFRKCKKYNCEPVGFLSPEGWWFLTDTNDTGLAHIELAPRIVKAFTEMGTTFNLHRNGGLQSSDIMLETNGFIKVHGLTIRYLAHFPCYNSSTRQPDYTPDITVKQKEALCSYINMYKCIDSSVGKININDHGWVSSNILKSMDDIAIRQLSHL